MESTVLLKSFSIVEALANRHGAVTLAELAIATGFTKPSVHRILQSLVAIGYVAPAGGGAYRLTGKLRQLSLGPAERWMAAHGEPALRRLFDEVGETVNLGVLRHNRIIYVSVIESTHALRRVARVAEGDPVLCTALGRAIASHLPKQTIDLILRTDAFSPPTPKTIVDPAKLREILNQAKRDGYAIERDQTDLGVTCVAVPVYWQHEVIAAISISAPTARVDPHREKQWAASLQKAAKKMEKSLNNEKRESA
jgi:DNA-binding IclR family transcriptional regulator